MTAKNSPLDETYRKSHASEGYGEHYETTYKTGYYAHQWDKLERPLLKQVFAKIPNRDKLRYLDFACGTGRILAVGEQYFDNATGVDISNAMIKVANTNCKTARFLERDITQEPIDEQFDVITAFRFFLNAEASLADQILSEIARMLPDGKGKFITNIHMNDRSITGLFYRFRNKISGKVVANIKSFKEFEKTLTKHGFQIEETHWYSFLPRTGWKLGWLPKYFMVPVDNLASRIPFMNKASQSFMIVCRKT